MASTGAGMGQSTHIELSSPSRRRDAERIARTQDRQRDRAQPPVVHSGTSLELRGSTAHARQG
eukprot:scaffold34877_cov115-Phaeocystis_antarctica.AAC.2